MNKKRFAIAGTGVRSLCFARALLNQFQDCAELVGLFDANRRRMAGFNQLLQTDIPAFQDFDRMTREVRPTHLIIGTPDHTHDAFIRMAFENDMDVICEKPLTTTVEKVKAILDLESKYQRKVVVAFNYRWVPYVARIKEIIMEGSLGKPLSVALDWHLDKVHGAEYFRRWHATMENSGGLLVHKSTHHFDLVNWLLDDEPATVSALGALLVYGANGTFRGERCSTCPHAGGRCPFEMKTHLEESDKDVFDKLYWDAEDEDGYIRDRCVYRESIDVDDTMNVAVAYRSGAQLSYTLNAYAPYEGYELHMTFEHGRIEARESHAGIFMHSDEDQQVIRLFRGTDRAHQTLDEIPVDVDKSAHGGGDNRLYRNLFRGDWDDRLHQGADSWAGAMSCLVGMAANRSIAEKRTVSLEELLPEKPYRKDRA